MEPERKWVVTGPDERLVGRHEDIYWLPKPLEAGTYPLYAPIKVRGELVLVRAHTPLSLSPDVVAVLGEAGFSVSTVDPQVELLETGRMINENG